MPTTFTVAIPTFNRKSMVLETIRSAYETNWPELEVIAVDDASTDGTGAAIALAFPEVRYLRLERNSGPGMARNTGISHASGAWIVLMDDDDMLRPDSLATIAEHLAAWPEAEMYPCVQFAHGNGALDQPFRLVRLEDYSQGRVGGDFVPVINRARFKQAGLLYPILGIGGEHLLWFEIARRYGIPTWNRCIALLGSEPRAKLCSTASQLARPKEYAELAMRTIGLFGDDIWRAEPRRYWKYAIGAVSYYLLAADRKAAIAAALSLKRGPGIATLALVATAGSLPTWLLRLLFRAWRYPLRRTDWRVDPSQANPSIKAGDENTPGH
jgi:GalNAc5-diNAcBac-PP-undecaprenol beta-1,3-glucosyltransferase